MRVHMKKYLFVVLLVGVCFSQSDNGKYNQERQQYEKESFERNKKNILIEELSPGNKKEYLRLIEKYGGHEGARIFNTRLSEKKYLEKLSPENKKEYLRLIEKHGKDEGGRIFNRRLSGLKEIEKKKNIQRLEEIKKQKEIQRLEEIKKENQRLEKIEKENQRLEKIEKENQRLEEIKKQKEIRRLEEIEKQKDIQRSEEIEKQRKQKEIQRLEKIEKQKEIKTFLFFVTVVAVSVIILIIVVKKERKNRKDKLIKLYGEKDGLNIFYKKISESSFKEEIQRNELIDKHGEELGLEIFNSNLSESDFIKRNELKVKHGEELGLKIFNSNLSEDEFFKKDLKTETIDKEQAKEKLKEAKENLDLELITQKEYDVLKEELKPFIMGGGDDLKPSEKISKDEKNTSKKGSSVMGWVVSMSLLGGGLGWILTSGGSSSNTTTDGSYDHCSSNRAEQFLYSNHRSINARITNVTLYSENGNIFTFGHISYPSNQLRNQECITKVICKSDGSYAIYDIDCKTF